MAKERFSRGRCAARRDLTRFLEAERGDFISTPPQMRRPYFPGFKLFCNTWGERMRSRRSYFLLVAFPAPPLEASQGGVQAAATAWTWAGVVPSLQKGGRFRRQPWKTAGERVTFAQGCSPAGIQEPPPPAITRALGMRKRRKTRRNKTSLELGAGSWHRRSSPAGWHFISKPAVSLHSCLQAIWCWRHPRSLVPFNAFGGHPSRWTSSTLRGCSPGSAAGVGAHV